MRTFKNITFLLFTILLPAYLQAQPGFSTKQQKVQQVVVKMFEDLSNRDATSLRQDCTPGVTFFEYGQIWNIDTLIAKAITGNKAADFKRVNSFAFISTEVHQNIATVSYRLNSVITREGKRTTLKWLETMILIRQKKHWKVQHLHSTLLKKD